ncbi:enoyl-CoA hydratase-related protein [Nonomuraea jabiensis]|uniref:enoyl-CoA hydratase-related protein n=1 Tax=Nonomuraea jabiensis TaxID=882448 RepID=UPI003694FD61
MQATGENGVLRVVLDNPPVNVLGAVMMREVRDLLAAVREDSSVKVIVFESANLEFFLAHVDIQVADRMDILQDLAASAPEGVNVFQLIGELIRRQPQVTIVKLAGKARGGGAEFVAAADLAYAAEETAGLGQVEALPAAQRIMGTALTSGAQTPDGERDLEPLLRTIAAQGA